MVVKQLHKAHNISPILLLISFILILMGLFSIASCKKDKAISSYPNFSQLKVGNYWIYEQYNIDTLGNATATGVIDSCYIEKDSLIHNTTYFKIVRPKSGAYLNNNFLRDSLHYVVNSLGQIVFSSQNFTDTLHQKFIIVGISGKDTVCEIFMKMADKNITVNTPAGSFQTISFKQIANMYPAWASEGNPRYTDARYAENIGIVTETLPFYFSNPNYIERRLVRYHLN